MKHRIDEIIKKSSKSSDFGLWTSDFGYSDFGLRSAAPASAACVSWHTLALAASVGTPKKNARIMHDLQSTVAGQKYSETVCRAVPQHCFCPLRILYKVHYETRPSMCARQVDRLSRALAGTRPEADRRETPGTSGCREVWPWPFS